MLPFMLYANDSILATRISEHLYFYPQNNNPNQILTFTFLDLKDYNLVSLLLEHNNLCTWFSFALC